MTVRHPTTLTCKEVVELVTELLDDAMPPMDRARIEQHLLVCPPCTLHVRQVEDTRALARELPAAPPSPQILDVFRRWKTK
jgi:anti-sigma factor RsiW